MREQEKEKERAWQFSDYPGGVGGGGRGGNFYNIPPTCYVRHFSKILKTIFISLLPGEWQLKDFSQVGEGGGHFLQYSSLELFHALHLLEY